MRDEEKRTMARAADAGDPDALSKIEESEAAERMACEGIWRAARDINRMCDCRLDESHVGDDDMEREHAQFIREVEQVPLADPLFGPDAAADALSHALRHLILGYARYHNNGSARASVDLEEGMVTIEIGDHDYSYEVCDRATSLEAWLGGHCGEDAVHDRHIEFGRFVRDALERHGFRTRWILRFVGGRVLDAFGSLDGVAFHGCTANDMDFIESVAAEDAERAAEDVKTLLAQESVLRAVEDHFLLMQELETTT